MWNTKTKFSSYKYVNDITFVLCIIRVTQNYSADKYNSIKSILCPVRTHTGEDEDYEK